MLPCLLLLHSVPHGWFESETFRRWDFLLWHRSRTSNNEYASPPLTIVGTEAVHKWRQLNFRNCWPPHPVSKKSMKPLFLLVRNWPISLPPLCWRHLWMTPWLGEIDTRRQSVLCRATPYKRWCRAGLLTLLLRVNNWICGKNKC